MRSSKRVPRIQRGRSHRAIASRQPSRSVAARAPARRAWVRLPRVRGGTAFRAPDGDVELRLERVDEPAPQIVAGDGRAWNAVSGRPFSGDHAALKPLFVTLWDRAAWELQHPAGTVHGGR